MEGMTLTPQRHAASLMGMTPPLSKRPAPMQLLQVSFRPEQIKALRRAARRRKAPVAVLIREALDAWLTTV